MKIDNVAEALGRRRQLDSIDHVVGAGEL